jgi:hypothetical protein
MLGSNLNLSFGISECLMEGNGTEPNDNHFSPFHSLLDHNKFLNFGMAVLLS